MHAPGISSYRPGIYIVGSEPFWLSLVVFRNLPLSFTNFLSIGLQSQCFFIKVHYDVDCHLTTYSMSKLLNTHHAYITQNICSPVLRPLSASLSARPSTSCLLLVYSLFNLSISILPNTHHSQFLIHDVTALYLEQILKLWLASCHILELTCTFLWFGN